MARALVTAGKGDLSLEELPGKSPAAGQVLVAPLAVGACGSDVELVDGAMDGDFVRYPLVLGHEWCGRVLESTVAAFSPGELVVAEGILPCRRCEHCVRGETNLCITYEELGFTLPGAAGDEVVVEDHVVHPLPAGASIEDGALVEPAAVVYQGLSRMALAPGWSCLVIGDGTIALLAVQLLRLFSPQRLVLAGRRAEQGELARACGADEALFDRLPDDRFDLVVEAAGTNEAVVSAVGAARRGGAVLLLGLPPTGTTAPLPVDTLINNDLLVRASFGYTSAAWRQVVRLLGGGSFRPGRIVTHRLGLERHVEALDLLRRPPSGSPRGKVMLFPAGGEAVGEPHRPADQR